MGHGNRSNGDSVTELIRIMMAFARIGCEDLNVIWKSGAILRPIVSDARDSQIRRTGAPS